MIIFCKDDVVVWLLFIDFIYAKVEHEGGARIFFLEEFFAGLLFLPEDTTTCIRIVCIDDELIAGQDLTIGQFDLGGGLANVFNLLHLGVETDFASLLLYYTSHTFGDFREPPLGVVDAVFVFDVGENTEEPGAFPG